MKKIIFFTVGLVLLAAGCNTQTVYQTQPATTPPSVATTSPVIPPAEQLAITKLDPSSGTAGSSVTISGSGFTAANNTVSFGGSSFSGYDSADGKTLQFVVPNSLKPNCEPGKACPQFIRVVTPGNYNISVSNDNGQSNEVTFTVVFSCPSNAMCAKPPVLNK